MNNTLILKKTYQIALQIVCLLWIFSQSHRATAMDAFDTWPADSPINIYSMNLSVPGDKHNSLQQFQTLLEDYISDLRAKTALPLVLKLDAFDKSYGAFLADPNGMMMFLAANEEREKQFYFVPAFNNPYVYKVRQGDLPISSLADLGGKTIGVFGSNSAPFKFLNERVPKAQIKSFESLPLLEGALSTQSVDVVLTNFDHFGYLNRHWSKVPITSRLAVDVPESLNSGHFAVHKSSDEMIAVLNYLAQISPSIPSFQRLKNAAESHQLTPALEKILMSDAPVNACIDPEGYPYQWVDEQGMVRGVLPNVLRKILDTFDLSMTFSKVGASTQHVAAVTQGLCDVAWQLQRPSDVRAEVNSTPVYQGKYLTIAHEDRLSLNSGGDHMTTWAVSNILVNLLPSNMAGNNIFWLITEPNQQIQPLLDGKADRAIIDSNLWHHNLYQFTQQGLVVVDDYDLETHLTLFVKDSTLLEILNLGIQMLPENLVEQQFEQTDASQIIIRDRVVVPWIQIVILLVVLVGIILTLLFFLRLSQRADYVHTQALDHTKRFLANMSHELRTPMNSILGMSELLSHDHKLDALQSEQANIIHRSGQHMLRLLNDVLDMSKIEAGEISLESIPVDIRRVVEDVAIQWRSRIEGKGLRFDCPRTLSLSVPFRMTDPTRLLQVLSNLVSNAVKFTSTGFIAVDVIQKANGDVLLRVEDTGIGIAKEHQSDVFKRFKQADDTINRRYGGTGLGLSISRSLVELMGGDLSFTSTLNEGTCFEMTLPLPMAEVVSDMSEQEVTATLLEDTLSQPAKVVSMTEAGQSAIRLLLVDDVATNNFVLSIMLKRLLGDVSIDEACSVAEAESLLQQNKYHAVFTDINMPEKTGIDLLTSIKKQKLQGVNPKLSVVACTGEEASLDLDMMFNASMIKPVAIEPLKSVLISLGLFRKKLPAAPSADMSSDKSNDPLDIEVSTSFLTNLARLSNASDWAETVVNPCLAYLDLLIDDMRKHLARGELSDVQHIAFHFNTIGSLLGDEEFKVIARRLMEAKPLQTQLALECFIEFGRRVKYHQKKKTVA